MPAPGQQTEATVTGSSIRTTMVALQPAPSPRSGAGGVGTAKGAGMWWTPARSTVISCYNVPVPLPADDRRSPGTPAYWPVAGGEARQRVPARQSQRLMAAGSPMIGRRRRDRDRAPTGRTGPLTRQGQLLTVASAAGAPLASARPTGPCLPGACHGRLRGCDRGEGSEPGARWRE